MRTLTKRDAGPVRGSFRFSRANGIFLGAGVASVAAGYALLAGGSTVAAPLLLVLGYAVLIPVGIIK
jgi:hypothetical protein